MSSMYLTWCQRKIKSRSRIIYFVLSTWNKSTSSIMLMKKIYLERWRIEVLCSFDWSSRQLAMTRVCSSDIYRRLLYSFCCADGQSMHRTRMPSVNSDDLKIESSDMQNQEMRRFSNICFSYYSDTIRWYTVINYIWSICRMLSLNVTTASIHPLAKVLEEYLISDWKLKHRIITRWQRVTVSFVSWRSIVLEARQSGSVQQLFRRKSVSWSRW